jgi:hypothetical protein
MITSVNIIQQVCQRILQIYLQTMCIRGHFSERGEGQTPESGIKFLKKNPDNTPFKAGVGGGGSQRPPVTKELNFT